MEKLNIGYIRVSTREQAKEGYSLSAQSKAIENYYGCMMEIEKFKILQMKAILLKVIIDLNIKN